jgi:hypothetical protein
MLGAVHGSNWWQAAFPDEIKRGEHWKAVVKLADGKTVSREVVV